jgi:hypothetical protein
MKTIRKLSNKQNMPLFHITHEKCRTDSKNMYINGTYFEN